MKIGYLARNQYGQDLHLTETEHPRKQLLAKTGGKHVKKMFADTKSGTTKHIGYVVNGKWWTLYEVHEWTGATS